MIAEEHSISRAAGRLFISQPALSQQLSKLEAQLGTPLFFRGKQDISLTQAGEVYVKNAIKILTIRNETYNQIYDIASNRKGTFSIGVSPGRSPMISSMAYSKLLKEFPDFNVRVFGLDNAKTEEMILHRKLDLGFLFLTDEEVSSNLPFSYISLGREDMYLVTSRNHPLASRYYQGSECPLIDLKLFQHESFALPTRGAKIRRFVDDLFVSQGISPTIRYEVLMCRQFALLSAKAIFVPLFPLDFCRKIIILSTFV